MKREYHSWHNAELNREMPVLAFGHAGAKVLSFPTRDGRFYEFENLGLVEVLRPRIEAGELQIWCVDGLNDETFYCNWNVPHDRLLRHGLFERYILDELLPFVDRHNDHRHTVALGLSLGAFHAADLAFRYPERFSKLVACSGRYDLSLAIEHFRDLLDGYRGPLLDQHTPIKYLSSIHGPALQQLRKMDITVAIGGDDPFLDNNRQLSSLLHQQSVAHQLQIWEGRAHAAAAWHSMVGLYL